MTLQLTILIVTTSLALVFGIFFFHYGKTPMVNRKPNYLAFFILGMIWIIVGLLISIYFISAIGAILTIIGALNKKHWTDSVALTKSEKRMRYVAIFGLIIFLFIGFFLLLLRPGI